MEKRKEWKSLYLINKQIYFLGFKPMQLVMISCLLFVIGFWQWWLVIFMLVPLYSAGQKLSKAHHSGNPDMILSLFVKYGMKKYFTDECSFFRQL